MLALGTADISQMRTELETTLPGTAVISTRTSTSDGMGGVADTFAASGTVAARLAPLSGNELELAARLSTQATHQLTVPYSTALVIRDQVAYNGVTYEVVQISNRVPWNLDKRALLEVLS